MTIKSEWLTAKKVTEALNCSIEEIEFILDNFQMCNDFRDRLLITLKHKKMIESTDNGVDFEMEQITPQKKNVKYFHTDIKGSIVQPKGFHAWLFIGTQKEYDNFLSEIMKDESSGKVIGEFSYDTYEEWNAVWGKPSGNLNDKI